MSVLLGCCDENAIGRVAFEQQTFVSHRSGGWKPKIKALADLVCRPDFFAVSSRGRGDGELSGVSL